MGNIESKGKSFTKGKKKNESDSQLLLKNRFYEIANGGSSIDKSFFFVSSRLFFPTVKFETH